MFGSAMWCTYFADLEIPRQILQDDDEAVVEVVHRPARGGGRHHAVELPREPGLLEDRPGPAGREHHRA